MVTQNGVCKHSSCTEVTHILAKHIILIFLSTYLSHFSRLLTKLSLVFLQASKNTSVYIFWCKRRYSTAQEGQAKTRFKTSSHRLPKDHTTWMKTFEFFFLFHVGTYNSRHKHHKGTLNPMIKTQRVIYKCHWGVSGELWIKCIHSSLWDDFLVVLQWGIRTSHQMHPATFSSAWPIGSSLKC